MSGARQALRAVVTALLAVALGLAVGAGPLVGDSATARQAHVERLTRQLSDLRTQADELAQRDRASARVLAALSGPLTQGRLAGRSVLLVRTPAATDALARSIRAGLLAAGASVTGELALTATFVDPAKAAAPLEDLALRLVPPNVSFPAGATPIERVATVLARSTVATSPPGAPDQDAAEVIAGLTDLGAIRLDGDPGRLARLAVVLTGAREPAASREALTALVGALDAAGQGAVLVGPGLRPAAVDWWRARGSGGASSVDSADAAAGRLATVLALVEQVGGGQGAYGAGRGATAVLPASVLRTPARD